MYYNNILIIGFVLLFASLTFGQDSVGVSMGGFVDTYYMYDFNSPGANQKSHPFTQPARHNEFNINLAHLEVRLASRDIRGALALHTGTSVRANYAAESDNRELSQLIHEAWAGYRVTDNLWIDAGIYPAPYGLEGWLSRDNKTYTRSLVADYSPYYQTGFKVSWQVSDEFFAGLHVINGWQNIAETNSDKAIGLTLGYTPSDHVSITYNNFIGNELPDSVEAAVRFYNNLCFRFTVTNDFSVDLTTDIGMQDKNGESTLWLGAALIGKYQLTEKSAVAVRGEYYKDEHQVIFVTGTSDGFDGFGASVNLDVEFTPQLLWRTEVRILNAKDAIFPAKNELQKQTGFIVSSFAITI